MELFFYFFWKRSVEFHESIEIILGNICDVIHGTFKDPKRAKAKTQSNYSYKKTTTTSSTTGSTTGGENKNDDSAEEEEDENNKNNFDRPEMMHVKDFLRVRNFSLSQ